MKMNRIVGVLLSLLMLSSFNVLAADAPKDVVRKLLEEVWSKGNLELTYQLISPEYQYHNPMIRIVGPTGPDLASSLIENRRSGIPDMTFEIQDIFAEDQKVVVRWTAQGTHKGAIGDVEATNKELSWQGTSIFHLAAGQILAEWTIDGFGGVLRELGVTRMEVRRGN